MSTCADEGVLLVNQQVGMNTLLISLAPSWTRLTLHMHAFVGCIGLMLQLSSIVFNAPVVVINHASCATGW